MIGETGRCHSGDCSHLAQHLILVGSYPARSPVLLGSRHPQREDVLRAAADVYASQPHKRLQEQAGANQQNKRQCDFRADQQGTQAARSRTPPKCPGATLERVGHIQASELNQWNEAERDGRQHGYREREREDAPIQGEGFEARHCAGGQVGQELERCPGQKKPQCASRSAQKEAFAKKLAHQLPGSGTQRRSHCHFFAPLRRPG